MPSRRQLSLLLSAIGLALAVLGLLGLLGVLVVWRDPTTWWSTALIVVAQLPAWVNLTAAQLSKGLHPTVEPTGERLEPQLAAAPWPCTFPLARVYRLQRRQWSRQRRRSRRLVLLPGSLWLSRPGDPIAPPGPNPFPGLTPVGWFLDPPAVRLVQPLVSRSGRPGVVLHLSDGSPAFLYGPAPREAVLTELAAAGFAVDGAEQVVSRRWAHLPKARPQPVPVRPWPL